MAEFLYFERRQPTAFSSSSSSDGVGTNVRVEGYRASDSAGSESSDWPTEKPNTAESEIRREGGRGSLSFPPFGERGLGLLSSPSCIEMGISPS